MSEEKIKNLKICEVTVIETEARSDAPLDVVSFPEMALWDQNTRANSSAPYENSDIQLKYGKSNREYPVINEHPAYWGIFARRGS